MPPLCRLKHYTRLGFTGYLHTLTVAIHHSNAECRSMAIFVEHIKMAPQRQIRFETAFRRE